MDDRYRAVFFDFGGTLYSYRNKGLGVRDVLDGLLERLGETAAPEAVSEAFRGASRAAYMAHHPRPYYLHRDLFMDTYRRFARDLVGREPDPELLQWCHERQCEKVIANFELRADCRETLERLRAAGLHVAIVSNIDDDYLQPMVGRAGLDELLDAWTSSEEAGSCKPHRGIFDRACAKADCEPHQALFVGDALEADVAGARPLGMTTVYLRADGLPEAPPDGPQPHHSIDSLAEVLEVAGLSGR